jgi:hypothetical protein
MSNSCRSAAARRGIRCDIDDQHILYRRVSRPRQRVWHIMCARRRHPRSATTGGESVCHAAPLGRRRALADWAVIVSTPSTRAGYLQQLFSGRSDSPLILIQWLFPVPRERKTGAIATSHRGASSAIPSFPKPTGRLRDSHRGPWAIGLRRVVARGGEVPPGERDASEPAGHKPRGPDFCPCTVRLAELTSTARQNLLKGELCGESGWPGWRRWGLS